VPAPTRLICTAATLGEARIDAVQNRRSEMLVI
jgi:hypothetical protein